MPETTFAIDFTAALAFGGLVLLWLVLEIVR